MTVSDDYLPPLFRYVPEVSALLFFSSTANDIKPPLFFVNFQYSPDDGMDRQSLQNPSTSYNKTRMALHGNVSS